MEMIFKHADIYASIMVTNSDDEQELQEQQQQSTFTSYFVLLVFYLLSDEPVPQDMFFCDFEKYIQDALLQFTKNPNIWKVPSTQAIMQDLNLPLNCDDFKQFIQRQPDAKLKRFPNFDKIFEVEWQRYTHAYGSAEDIPEMLKDLASQSDRIRKSVQRNFYANLYHQGSRYSATVVAVPFLVEFLECSQVKDKDFILEYLVSILVGSNDYIAVQGVTTNKFFNNGEQVYWEKKNALEKAYEAKKKSLFDSEESKEAAYAKLDGTEECVAWNEFINSWPGITGGIYCEVRKGIFIYLSMLSTDSKNNNEIRKHAAILLCKYL